MIYSRALSLAAALLVLAACSSAPPPAPTTPPVVVVSAQPPTSAPTLTACATLWTPGTVIPADLAATGCTDPQGGISIPGSFNCRDGTVLFSDSRWWGYAGEVTHVGEAASDPAYKKAYTACNS